MLPLPDVQPIKWWYKWDCFECDQGFYEYFKVYRDNEPIAKFEDEDRAEHYVTFMQSQESML